ncbi:MAG: RNA methyltransferase [Flavobacterium sp.]|nr:RNA methyltransferase [Flavobacterium sp.]
MRKFKSDKRLEKIINTVKNRQYSLHVVLENIHDPHNVSAIFRTCDAVGIPKVSLLYTFEKFPKVSRISSASANKWVEKERFTDTGECFDKLHAEGYQIYASMLSKDAVNFYDLDFTKKVAIVVGNEHRGISEEAAKKADKIFYIPMQGMIQSLNVSVAAAVILFEAERQRILKGMYPSKDLTKDEIDKIIDEWCTK